MCKDILGPLEEVLGFSILALFLIYQGKIVEGRRDLRVLWSKQLLVAR